MSEHSDQSESTQSPWEDRNSWIRILYMLLFGFIFWFCHFIVFAFAIIETIHRLITGESCIPLQSASRRLGLYVKQLADFLMYNHEHHPFPLNDFPPDQADQHEADPVEAKDETSADEANVPQTQVGSRKKASRKKKSSTKKTSSKRAKSDEDNDSSEDTAANTNSTSTDSET